MVQTTIFCLLSVQNQYYQPNNNLVAWWAHKPTFAIMATAFRSLGYADEGVQDSETAQGIGLLLNGQEFRIDHTNYRLEEVRQGEMLKQRPLYD